MFVNIFTGVPLSDMLPGVSVGVPTDMDGIGDTHEGNPMEASSNTGAGSPYGPSLQGDAGTGKLGGNPELSINKLTDYDILDVDLEVYTIEK